MPYQDPIATAEEKLSALSSLDPDQTEFYASLTALIQSKLYHQVTVAIHEFTSSPTNANIGNDNDAESNNFLTVYAILLSFKSKLNPLMLARIACNVSVSQGQTVGGGITILKELLETDEIKSAPHAKLFTEAKLHLLQMNVTAASDTESSTSASTSTLTPASEEAQVKKFLKDNALTLQELSNSTESEVAVVHSAYYLTAKELYKKVGPAEDFYKNAISYLQYTPLSDLEAGEVNILARDLSLSALVGKGVYNLGTVVYENGTLLDVLKDTEDGYLVELMKSLARGDVAAVKALESHKAQLEAQGCDLKVIHEKIMLLALVNMVFEKESNERSMKFDDIAKRLEVDLDQVEWIIMKALSLGLIKGSMDQVDGFVEITWVMPRVLDENMMKGLSEKFGAWAVKVGETRAYMTEHIPAI